MPDFSKDAALAADRLVEPVNRMLGQALKPRPEGDISTILLFRETRQRPVSWDYAIHAMVTRQVLDMARTISEDKFTLAPEPGVPRINVSDVAKDLSSLAVQLEDLRRRGERCPTARLEDNWIPILLDGNVDPSRIQVLTNGQLRTLEVSEADLQDIPNLMSKPLAQFLAWRIFASSTTLANVELTTVTMRWQAFYSPPHVVTKNGFGGSLTSPALGYVPPGNWRFGITNAGVDKLDSTSWPIPPHVGAPIPHKIAVAL
jgi:hypothetical protein